MREERQARLLEAMIEFDKGDPKRIQHFLKVWTFARQIGQMEGLDEGIQCTLETAAIVHDIGIHACEEKYGSTSGSLQEKEGPPLAREMLTGLGYEPDRTERVCWLVGHHHTYSGVETADHQILLEADFLVNSYEEEMEESAIRNFCGKVFRTKSGIRLLELQYGIRM